MIVFGDSFTSGENNGYISFADYLGIEKKGISGSCLDEYSIYPVVKGGLLSQKLPTSGVVLLEYGVNDAASIVTGNASYRNAMVAIAKTYDLLKDAEVYFLKLTNNEKDLVRFSSNYAKYLTEDYLKGLYEVDTQEFCWCYLGFCDLMQKKFKTLYMLPDGFKEYDTDGIHPTDKGYRLIADNLRKQIKKATN